MHAWLFCDSGMIVSDGGAFGALFAKDFICWGHMVVKYGLESMYIVKGFWF